MDRSERRARTERIVKRRLKAAPKGDTFFRAVPGKLRKKPPVCYCRICRMSRKRKYVKAD